MNITLSMLLYLALSGTGGAENAAAPLPVDAADLIDPARNDADVIRTGNSAPVRGIRIHGGGASASLDPELLYVRKQKTGAALHLGGKKIPLASKLDFAEIFNKLEAAFIALRDWDMQLHQGIIENKGLQYMLDVSEPIFNHTMTLTDPGYKMIAYTKNWGDGDVIFHNAIEKGYLPPQAIEAFDRAGFIFEKEGIVYRKGLEGLSYPMMNGTIITQHNYRYMLTCLFPKHDYTPGLGELFELLVAQLTLYAETNGDASRIRRFAWVSLLADLMDGKCAPEEFEERNRYSGLPEGSEWRLVSVGRTDGTMCEFTSERLEQTLPDQIVFIQNGSIHVLLHDDRLLEKILSVANENKMLVSISARFSSLSDLHRAATQTKDALRIGLLIATNQTLKTLDIAQKAYEERVFHYEEYYPYCLIAPGIEIKNRDALSPVFMTMLRDDIRSGAGNLRLLYAWLKNDCSNTKTASALFMHRNNVIYRLGRIEEALGIPLSDENFKTSLRTSFLALELIDPDESA